MLGRLLIAGLLSVSGVFLYAQDKIPSLCKQYLDYDNDGRYDDVIEIEKIYDELDREIERLAKTDVGNDGDFDRSTYTRKRYDIFGNNSFQILYLDNDYDGNYDLAYINELIYNQNGNIFQTQFIIESPVGNAVREHRFFYEYDGELLMNIIEEKIINPEVINPETSYKKFSFYEYNDEKLLVRLRIDEDITINETIDRIIDNVYEYNAENEIITEIQTKDNSADGTIDFISISEKEYSNNGLIVYTSISTDTNNDGVINKKEEIWNTYDNDDLIVVRRYIDKTGDGEPNEKWIDSLVYDTLGNVINQLTYYYYNDGSFTQNYTDYFDYSYDDQNQMVWELNRYDMDSDDDFDWISESNYSYHSNGQISESKVKIDNEADGEFEYTRESYLSLNDYEQPIEYIRTVDEDSDGKFEDYLYRFNEYCERIVSTADIDVERTSALFPNPTTGIMYFKPDFDQSSLVKIEVLDMAGRKCSSFERHELISSTLDLSNLDKGMYFLLLLGKEKNHIQQVFIH